MNAYTADEALAVMDLISEVQATPFTADAVMDIVTSLPGTGPEEVGVTVEHAWGRIARRLEEGCWTLGSDE